MHPALETLCGPGKPLKAEAPDAREIVLIDERRQEEQLVHRLFEVPLAEDVAALASDYQCFTTSLPMAPGSVAAVEADAVYAPFNQNTYLCTFSGWRYVGSFPTTDAAAAALAPWCVAQQAKPCRNAHLKALTKAQAHSNPGLPLSKARRFGRALRTELLVLAFLVVLGGLCWLWYRAVEAWPWVLPGLMVVMFMVCGVALWMQRKKKP